MTAATQREREPRRLAHRAAEQSRHQAASRWLTEEIDEAMDIDDLGDRVSGRPAEHRAHTPRRS
jgi:hypothetical protein